MNTIKVEVPSPQKENMTSETKVNYPEEITGESKDLLESSTMEAQLQNMLLEESTSSRETITDMSINSSPTQSILENCDGFDSASFLSISPKPPIRCRSGGCNRNDGSELSRSSSSSSWVTYSSNDSYTSCSSCSCSGCSDCGGSNRSSHQSSTSFESTDDLTNKPRGKRGSPLSKKDAKKIYKNCSQS